MKVKTNLNNVQRKMLDEIYSKQFDELARPIMEERQRGLDKLTRKVLRDEQKKDPVKKVLKAWKEAVKLSKQYQTYFEDRGLSLSNSTYSEYELSFKRYSNHEHPEILKYQAETDRIHAELVNRKKEIRARIFGMETTFEDVDAEIKKYIADITSAKI